MQCECRLEPPWSRHWDPEASGGYVSTTETHYSPYFWRDYFELSHLLRLQGLALLYQNCCVKLMNCIVKHHLSTFQKSFSLLPSPSSSRAVTKPLWCVLLKQSFLILRCTVILLTFHHKKGMFLVPLTM